MNEPKKFYGKYKGTVVNNIDPEVRGRIQVLVPDVSNIMISTWAMPCVPVAGIQMGMFTVPPIGAGVWIEFEQGNPDYPIWVGCFWGTAAEVPSLSLMSPPPIPSITLQTVAQNGIIISDNPAIGITIKTLTGASIMVNDLGIMIQNGKGASIAMTGPTVNINFGALSII